MVRKMRLHACDPQRAQEAYQPQKKLGAGKTVSEMAYLEPNSNRMLKSVFFPKNDTPL